MFKVFPRTAVACRRGDGAGLAVNGRALFNAYPVGRAVVTMLACLCAPAAWLALGVGEASAAVTHNYLFQFSEVPASPGVSVPGPLTVMNSITVDSGHVWIDEHVDGTSSYRVDEFEAATGAFLRQLVASEGYDPEYLGVAVGRLAGEPQPQVYLAQYEGRTGTPEIGVYDESGTRKSSWTGAETPAKSFGVIEDVAVDGSSSLADWAAGDVYVPDPSNGVIDVFHPEAGGKEKYVTQLTGTEPGVPFGKALSMAVDPANGDLVVADSEKNTVDIFEPTAFGEYALVRELTATPSETFERLSSVAVNGASGDVYVVESERGRVFQFSAQGSYLDSILGTPEGAFQDPSNGGGVSTAAVDAATGDVYIGAVSPHNEGTVDVFGPNLIVPDVVTEAVTSLEPTSVTLNGTVDPDGEGQATCQFAWGTSAAFGQLAACSEPVANGTSPVAVQADVTGLQPDTTYHYRLQASNANGTNPGEASEDRELTTLGPGIRQQWASSVASSSASLDARIDPNGAPTSYYVEYGTTASYGSEAPAAPGAAIGAGQSEVEVTQHVQGLQADTTYHYRVVAVSELSPGETEAFFGPDGTFSTQPPSSAFALPDGRSWEMVSPPDKQAGTLESTPAEWGGLIQAANDGSSITYIASAPTEEQPHGNLAVERVQLLSSRAAAGWSTKVITTYHNAASGILLGDVSEYKLFSEDLSLGVVEPKGDTPLSEETSEQTPYLRHDTTCDASPASCYQPLVTAGNVPAGTKFGGAPGAELGHVHVAGASPDLSHVVLSSAVPLTEAPAEEWALYEWDGGRLLPVSVLPASEGGAVVQAELGGTGSESNARGAVSEDGSKIVWRHGSHLYVTDMEEGQAVRIDVPEVGAAGGAGQAVFQIASDNSTKVFFTDTAQLTTDSTASEKVSPAAADLYEYDGRTGKLSDLTVDSHAKEHAAVQGLVLGASREGDYVYFVANGALAAGAASGDCSGEFSAASATCNLYVLHNGVTTFVAALSGEDHNGSFSPSLEGLTARVSPDGRWLAFMSDASLTGYDNRDAGSGVRDEEVFIYDASSGRLSCASCDPTGARPAGAYEAGEYPGLMFDHLFTWGERWLAAAIPGWNGTPHAAHQPRYLSDSGRLYFDSSGALQPRDTNGTWDVYQYEPAGVGGCGSPNSTFDVASNGCVDLISSGGSAEESTFADASENGDDVFFLTASQLVAEDYDHALDLYDAHACSSASPCLSPSPAMPPPCSTGDSCKPAPSPQPESFGAPSSETFAGAGNFSAPTPPASATPKSLTAPRKFARALRECHRKRGKRRRAACERQARRVYGRKADHKSTVGKSTRTGR